MHVCMHFSTALARELLRHTFRHAFDCCGAAHFATRTLHASTTARWSSHGARGSRNARHRNDQVHI
eukprot:10343444-Lingulodinium_polyedra.AAC.1